MKTTETPFADGDHVLAYVRDSGHETQELSVERQEDTIRDFCIEHGLILNRCYTDAARKGSDPKREQLAQLMHDLKHGMDVAGVIVWSNSRFARNANQAQLYRAEIRSWGYIFYSLSGGHPFDGPEAILFEAFDDYRAERYLTDLVLDIKSGQHALVEKYGCVPGRPPVGFKRVPVVISTHRDGAEHIAHRWEPDPAITPRVQKAFEMRASGKSLGEIVKETMLYPAINSYRTFFLNRLYTGTLVFGDDLVIEDYCAPVVSRELWDAVQAVQNKYTQNRNLPGGGRDHPRRVNSKYLLSGLIYCGRCGSPLFGRTHPQKNGSQYTSYFCTRAYRTRDCSKQRIPGAKVEQAVITALKEKWLTPEYVNAARDELQKKHDTLLVEREKTRKQISGLLAELRRQTTNIANAIADGGHNKALLKRLDDLEKQEIETQNKLQAFDSTSIDIPQVNLDHVKKLVNLLDVAFPTVDIQTRRRILSGIISRIDADRDGRRIFGAITVYFPPDEPDSLPPINGFDGGQKMYLCYISHLGHWSTQYLRRF